MCFTDKVYQDTIKRAANDVELVLVILDDVKQEQTPDQAIRLRKKCFVL